MMKKCLASYLRSEKISYEMETLGPECLDLGSVVGIQSVWWLSAMNQQKWQRSTSVS